MDLLKTWGKLKVDASWKYVYVDQPIWLNINKTLSSRKRAKVPVKHFENYKNTSTTINQKQPFPQEWMPNILQAS